MKNTLLKIVNSLLFLCVLIQFSGIILFNLIGIDPPSFYYAWSVHKVVGLTIGVLVICHLQLNWSWVKNNVFGSKKKKG